MRRLLVITAILLLVAAQANAYVMRASSSESAPSATFGTGQDQKTVYSGLGNVAIDDPTVPVGSAFEYCSVLFFQQDPGSWTVTVRPPQPGGFGTNVKLYVTDLGPEGPSSDVWRICGTDAISLQYAELWRGQLLSSAPGTAMPVFSYSWDFGIIPAELTIERVVPEPSALLGLLSGLAGVAGISIRRRK